MTDLKCTLSRNSELFIITAGLVCAVFLAASSYEFGSLSIAAPAIIDASRTSLPFLVAAIVLLCLLSSVVRRSWIRKALALFTIAVFVVWSVSCMILENSESINEKTAYILVLVHMTTGRLLGVLLLAQWSLHFALCTPSEVFKCSLAGFAATIALYLLHNSTAFPNYFVIIAAAASCALCLFAEIALLENPRSAHSLPGIPEKITRTAIAGIWRERIVFVFSRIAWGIVIGFFIGLLSGVQQHSELSFSQALLAVASIVILLSTALMAPKKKSALTYLIVAVPAGIICLVFAAFGIGKIMDIGRLAPTISTIMWGTLLLVQHPTYRDVLQLDLPTFAFVERSITTAAIAIATYAATALKSNANSSIFLASAGDIILLSAFLCIAVITLIMLGLHIFKYYPSESEGIKLENEAETKAQLISTLHDNFALTEREVEICCYLAKGYSRPYIARVLYLSPNTVKTHAHNIYGKLLVRSQDELIEKIDALTNHAEKAATE